MSCDCGICRRPQQRDRFVDALSELGIEAVMITEESALSDFCLDDRDLATMAKRLGVPVAGGEFVADVLQRMADQEKPSTEGGS